MPESLPFRISDKHKSVLIKADLRVKNIIPHVREFRKGSDIYYLVPHKSSEVKLLGNLGYTLPSPINYQYDWNDTTPFDSQRVTAAMLTLNRRAYVLNDMGTGKTRSTLYAIDFLKRTGELNKVLVVAPLSTLTQVWELEVFSSFPHLDAICLYGTKKQRLAALSTDADIYVINHDGVKVIEDELRQRGDIDCIVIDELAAYRNARTNRFKSLNSIVKTRRWAWGLTGAPTPNAPTDAWAQCRLLTPSRVPKYYKAFQNEVMYQVSQFRWLPRNTANGTVHKAMQPAVRFTRSQCVDLPETMYTTRENTMNVEQERLYKDVLTKFHAEYDNKEITAANEGVKLGKLLQIAGGYVYSSDKQIASVGTNHRLENLKELLEETKEKVIIFAPYIHMVDSVYNALGRLFSIEKVYGDTPKAQRDKIFNLFQNSAHPRVLVAHPQCMSHGLTLTAASTIVWYSPTMSLEIYEQANARITRPGQKNSTYIVHMESSPVERRVYSRLRSKGKMQGVLLDLFAENDDLDD